MNTPRYIHSVTYIIFSDINNLEIKCYQTLSWIMIFVFYFTKAFWSSHVLFCFVSQVGTSVQISKISFCFVFLPHYFLGWLAIIIFAYFWSIFLNICNNYNISKVIHDSVWTVYWITGVFSKHCSESLWPCVYFCIRNKNCDSLFICLT